jgi:hypothetical protein
MSIGRGIAGLVFIALLSTSALADSIVNGGFETGNFTGWLRAGDANVISSGFAVSNGFPASGSNEALITTAGAGASDPRSGAYGGDYGVLCSKTSSCGTDSIGTFSAADVTNLARTVYSPFNSQDMGGGGIQQTFTGNAGDILRFDWNYLTNDPFEDIAFVELDNQLILLADYFSAGLLVPGTSPPFLHDSGFQTFSATLTTSGSHHLMIGVVNTGDGPWAASGLVIDNVATTAVPEPSTWLLLASGLVGIAAIRNRWARLGRDYRALQNR